MWHREPSVPTEDDFALLRAEYPTHLDPMTDEEIVKVLIDRGLEYAQIMRVYRKATRRFRH